MSPLGHVTPLSAHTLASLSAPHWLPLTLACIAVAVVGVCALALARECAE